MVIERQIPRTFLEQKDTENQARAMIEEQITWLCASIGATNKKEKAQYFDQIVGNAVQWLQTVYDLYKAEYDNVHRLLEEREQIEEFLTEIGVEKR